MEPNLRKKADWRVNINYSHKARRLKSRAQPWSRPLPPDDVSELQRRKAWTQRMSRAATWPSPKTACNRTGKANNCRKCLVPRTAETGHSQFKGTIYCVLC